MNIVYYIEGGKRIMKLRTERKPFIKLSIALLTMLLLMTCTVSKASAAGTISNPVDIAFDTEYTESLDKTTTDGWWRFSVSENSYILLDAKYTHGYFRIDDTKMNEKYYAEGEDEKDIGEYWSLVKGVYLKKGTYYINYRANTDYDENRIIFTAYNRTDTVRPKAPTVKKVDKKTGLFKGKADKSSTVKIKIGKKTYSGKANKKGAFSVKTTKVKKGKKVTIYCISKKGIKGKTAEYKVK